MYNEKYVVEGLLDALAQLDYPRHLYEILVLDDSTDETSLLPCRLHGAVGAKHNGRDARIFRSSICLHPDAEVQCQSTCFHAVPAPQEQRNGGAGNGCHALFLTGICLSLYLRDWYFLLAFFMMCSGPGILLFQAWSPQKLRIRSALPKFSWR